MFSDQFSNRFGVPETAIAGAMLGEPRWLRCGTALGGRGGSAQLPDPLRGAATDAAMLAHVLRDHLAPGQRRSAR
jgi:hypothetical protein